MADDMQLIKQLEKEIGEVLIHITTDGTFPGLSCFSMNENGNVTMLHFATLKLEKIPLIITKFHHLKELWLPGNKISDIIMLKDLGNLKILDLRNNEISELPEEILELPMEIKWWWDLGNGIYLEDNPLEYPPIEIVQEGKEAIKNYFQALAGEKQALNEVKVLLVGDGGTGKTSLVKRLLEQGFDQNEPNPRHQN